MHAGLLDVLHDRADVRLLAVAERVDVDLDRVLEEPVDEHAPVTAAHRLAHVVLVVADAHRAAAEHVRGPDEHRVADALGDLDRLAPPSRPSPTPGSGRRAREQRAEALAILGEVDRVERRARGS